MQKFPFVAVACGLVVACTQSTFIEPPGPNPAAGLSAPNQDGRMVSLREACSGPWAVVFFYPEADTPG